ncbi:MAG: SLC13 family permease [Phycisphaerae bacterium]|nr:SLC13 family permease [Phycisphaerae bacterium]
MSWQAWTTLGVLISVLVLLARTRIASDIILVAALTLLLVAGIISPREALSGLANPGVITVAVLFVVVAGVRSTGALSWIAHHVLGRPTSQRQALSRVIAPVGAMSAFLNNTPVVAMFIPTLSDWARKHRLPAGKLLLPLSYAAILGGMCTLIGTSTNLVVNGLLLSETNLPGLGMFDLAWVGVPCALVGGAYLLLVGPCLPDRKPAVSATDDPREYTVEMLVEPGSPLAGQTIEQAGLRNLPGAYLMEIERDGEPIVAVGPDQKLHSGDRLVFVGVVESVRDLRKIRGLTPATDQVFKLPSPQVARRLVEAVVSNSCPLVGRTIREGQFRSVYGAVVIAVARNAERLRKKIGDIVLAPGDTLLLETDSAFARRQRNSRDFFLVSELADSAPPRHSRAPVALLVLAAMVALVAAGLLSMLQAAMLAAGAMLVTRCLTGGEARQSVDWQVLVTIAAALGIGQAVARTGLAEAGAQFLLRSAAERPWAALAVIGAMTSLIAGFITSNATAVLMFPLAASTAAQLDVSVMPFAVVTMITAAGSFATPLGYQTNLMVYGPGGYRFGDYLRAGLPLNALVWGVSVAIAPLVWAF